MPEFRDRHRLLPSQSGEGGKTLFTDGREAYWDTPSAGTTLPDQTGHASEFLQTDGSALLWAVPAAPTRRRILYALHGDFAWDGIGETDVLTFSLPANTLETGKGLCVKSTFRANGDANGKTLRIYFGATKIREVAVASGTLYRYMEWTLWSWFSDTFQELFMTDYNITSSHTSNTSTATQAPSLIRLAATEDITAPIDIRMTINQPNCWGRHLVVELLE